ncbi:Arc family DNA-binding protein [Candidatus Acetothermia bacterium]|nr:Arc family DNA-binding protein [Candidatus Acetothermia bacterium]
MATLHVRRVPDKLYERLKARAQADGRSLSAEVLMILERALARPPSSQKALLQSLERRRRFSPAKAGAPSSFDLLRESRER